MVARFSFSLMCSQELLGTNGGVKSTLALVNGTVLPKNPKQRKIEFGCVPFQRE